MQSKLVRGTDQAAKLGVKWEKQLSGHLQPELGLSLRLVPVTRCEERGDQALLETCEELTRIH